MVDVGLDELGREADRVRDGPRVRAPMSDDDDAVDAEQQRASVLGVVDLLLELLQVIILEKYL